MKMKEIKGIRAVHDCGTKRIDRREKTSSDWEYQMKLLLNQDEGPEWAPVDKEQTRHWPEDGWNAIDDW